MEYKNLSIKDYVEEVAKKASVPGGGSVLALVNELSSSLLLMVCNFTIDKKGYETQQRRIKELIRAISIIKDDCHNIIDDDANAFSALMKAFSNKDKQEIAKYSYDCAYVPFRLLKNALSLIDFSKEIIEIGNSNLKSDAQIAYDLAYSSLKGCKHHIIINLDSIDDKEKKDELINCLKILEETYGI